MSRSKVDVYSRDAYCFCEGKSHKPHRDRTPQARLQRLAVRFSHNHWQTVNRVAGILLLHTSPAPGLSIPHVIILREEVKTCSEEVGTTNNSYFSLPGGRCRDLEDDRTCLQRKLHTLLGVLSVVPSEPESGRLVTQTVPAAACSATLNNLHMSAEMSTPFAPNSRKRSHSETEGYSDLFNADDTTNKTRKGKVLLEQEKHLEREESVPKIPSSGFAPHAPASDAFIIGELITEWFRPACENLMYPYIPPHCTKPMEVCRVYMIHAPSNYTFTIPQNRHILAVPTYELYDNQTVYNSALLASLPQCISRYQMNFV